MSELWTEKYAPRSLKEVYGNSTAIEVIKAWALDWKRGKKGKPLLLNGPPGIGKTACARALAEEMGWEILETNASDLRDSANVKKLVGAAASTGTLFGGLRLVLVDEVDSALDRGEVPALSRVVEEAAQPVILTANDAWNPKLAALRTLCERIDFKRLGKVDVRRKLADVAEREGTVFEEGVVENCGGDMRGALIDMQAGGASEREREENVFEGMKKVFKGSLEEALEAQDASGVDLDLFIRWVEENIPNEYEKEDDIAKAFDWLSKSSVFSARIFRRQNYKLQKFERALALGGVASSKETQYRKFTAYQFPGYIRRMAQSRQKRALAKSAWSKASAKLHCSSKKAKEAEWAYAPYAGFFGWTEEETGVAPKQPVKKKV
ncbi:replication factor C large subunit [Candidatus Micrarchaeota archaeon]|nr:replication factor C large subunit [Candidatus Micrarchaeota archaeon]